VSVADSPREGLGKVVDGLVNALDLYRPTDEAIDEALKAAASYKVTTAYHAPTKLGKPVRYFALAPEFNLPTTVERAIVSASPHLAESARALFSEMKSGGRVIDSPHVTLAHKKNVELEREVAGEGTEPGPHEGAWNSCKALTESKISPTFDFDMSYLVWDDRVMALAIDNLRAKAGESEFSMPDEEKGLLHITVGTRTRGISAYEARGIIRAAREGIPKGLKEDEPNDIEGESGGQVRWIELERYKGEGTIRGMY